MWLALLVIALFDVAGEAASRFLHVPLPGPVIGMVLLFAALVARSGWAAHLQRGGDLLLRHMALFFVPAGVGVVTQLHVLQAEWVPVCVSLLGSTVIGLLVATGAFVVAARARGRS
jgi:holin-like protein